MTENKYRYGVLIGNSQEERFGTYLEYKQVPIQKIKDSQTELVNYFPRSLRLEERYSPFPKRTVQLGKRVFINVYKDINKKWSILCRLANCSI